MSTDSAKTYSAIEALRVTPLCESLDEQQLATLAGQVRVQPFVAGETLANAGDPVTEFWIVADGEIEAHLVDTHGRESLIGIARQGETVGEVAILEKAYRPVRFSARTHGALLVTSAEQFHAWMETYPSILRNLFRTLSQRFKKAVGIIDQRKPARRLGIIAPSPRGRLLTTRLMSRLSTTGERLRVWADLPESLSATGQWPEAARLQMLAEREHPLRAAPEADCDRRVMVWTPGKDVDLDIERLQSCDEVLWFMEPTEGAAVDQQLRRWPAAQSQLTERTRIVWLLDDQTRVAPILSGFEWSKAPLKVPVESTGKSLSRLERQGLDRLVRVLRGYSIGIALAGGGAKGMAHFGVLKALEEAGITFDAMSGTSAGAMAGILYASGMSPEEGVQNFERDLTPSRWFQMLPKWPNWYLLSQFRRRAWEAMLRKYLHDWRLEQLQIPFRSVTVDLVQVRPVVRDQGDAVHAILESINLPVVSRPILRDGMVLVDGGVLNNLPADVLAESNIDYVVGVDVSSRVLPEFAGNRPELPTHKMKPVNTLDTMLRIFEAQAHNIGSVRNRAVDFWITPDTSRFSLANFNRTREISLAGEESVQVKLAELKQAIIDLEQRLLGARAKT